MLRRSQYAETLPIIYRRRGAPRLDDQPGSVAFWFRACHVESRSVDKTETSGRATTFRAIFIVREIHLAWQLGPTWYRFSVYPRAFPKTPETTNPQDFPGFLHSALKDLTCLPPYVTHIFKIGIPPP